MDLEEFFGLRLMADDLYFGLETERWWKREAQIMYVTVALPLLAIIPVVLFVFNFKTLADNLVYAGFLMVLFVIAMITTRNSVLIRRKHVIGRLTMERIFSQ